MLELRAMPSARHSQDDHAKVCESVDNLAMPEEDDHANLPRCLTPRENSVARSSEAAEDDQAKVRAIVDEGLTQLMQWLDLRLQQQEDNLRSLLIAQGRQRRQESFKMDPQVTSQEQDFKPNILAPPRSPTQGLASKQSVNQAIKTRGRQSVPSLDGSKQDMPNLTSATRRSQRPSQRQGTAIKDITHIQSEAKVRAQLSNPTREPQTPSSGDPEQIWISSLMDIFDQLDLKGTGCIDLSEFETAVKETGFSKVQALAVFSSMDESHNGTIDRLEWLHMISQSARGSDDEMALLKDFLSRLVQLQRSHGNIYQAGRARKARMILRHDSIWRVMWDMMLIVLLFYVAVSLPFSLGFGSSKALDVSELVVDIIFCLDVALNFRTSFTDKDDTIVVDWKKIGIRYLKTWFVLDFFASFPFDVITIGLLPNLTPARLLKIGKIAKVLKFLRITKIVSFHADSERIERMKIRLSSVAITRLLRILKLLSIAFLVCHWLACFVSTVDSNAFDDYFYGLDQAPDVLQKYLASMYWAMTTISTVGYGDITPVSDQERAFAMLAMVVGGSLYGFVVGSVTSIVTDMDVHANVYNERMELLQSWLDRNSQIPVLLRRRLRKHFKHALLARTVISDDSVIDQLSGELRGDAAFFLVDEHVRHHPMVAKLPNSALAEIVYVLQETEAKRHELIVQVDDPGIGMYFLVEGLARYDKGSKWQPPGAEITEATRKQFQHIMIGESFGEEIIFGLAEHYAYTVITIVDCRFCFIDESRFAKHFTSLPELRDRMYKAVVHPDISPQANTISSMIKEIKEYAV